MAQVTRSNIAPLHDKISVKISKEDFMPSFEKSLKQYAKNANVPGFRKGHVPAGMIKKMYGPSIYQEEVLRTVSKELEDYLTKERLAIFGQPMALPSEAPQRMDMSQPDDFTFDFEVGLKPEFEVPALSNGHVLTRYKVGITEDMVNEEILRITRSFGQMEDLEALENEEDIVFFETAVANEKGEKERPIMINQLPEALRTKMIGLKAGEELELNLETDFPKEDERAGFAREILNLDAPEGTHKVKIARTGRINAAALDEGLFAQVFPNDTPADEAAFRARVKEGLQGEYDRLAEDRLDNEIFETLVHTTPVELPKDFLKRWMQQGNEQEKPKTAEQVEGAFPQMEHQLKWSLISDKLIGENGIHVGIEDIRSNIKNRLMGYFGIEDAEDAPWMEGYMKSVEKDEKMMNETYQQLLFGRLFQKLREKFALEEKEIDVKAFSALPQPGAGHHQH